MQSDAAQSAADTQAAAANNAAQVQQNMFNTQNAQLAPNRATGYSGLNQIASMLPGTQQTYDAQGNPIGTQTGTGYLTQQFPTYQNFTNADLNAQLAPNYQWQLGQGQQATNAQNNATGGLIGGNALKGLQDYTQNFAGNAYQNALNNYMSQQQLGFNQNQTQRGNIYNTLASIAGLGQTAQNTSAQLSANTANSIGQLGVGAANAQAAGQIGSANAITGALGNAGNVYSLSNILNSGNQTYGSGTSNAAGGISLIGGGGGNAVSNYNPSILES